MSAISIFIILLLVVLVAYLLYSYAKGKLFSGAGQRLLITVQEPWFSELKSGKKKVEGRVGSDEFYKRHVGKTVKVGLPGGEKIKMKLVAVAHYDTLDEFVKKEGVKAVAPSAKTEKEAIDMLLAMKDSKGVAIFSPDRVKEKGGVASLKLELEK